MSLVIPLIALPPVVMVDLSLGPDCDNHRCGQSVDRQEHVTTVTSMLASYFFLLLLSSQCRATLPFHTRSYDYDLHDYDDRYLYHFLDPLYYDVRYDLPEDIIRNKRDSRYFPGHVPAGVKGITKVL